MIKRIIASLRKGIEVDSILFAFSLLSILASISLGSIKYMEINKKHDFRVEKDAFSTFSPDIQNNEENGLKIVASKNGKKYYFEHCAGAKRIKKANKIWFFSEKEAQNKGLTLAKGCS